MGFFRKTQPDRYTGDEYFDVAPAVEPSASPLEPSEKAPGSTLNIGGGGVGNMELKVMHPTSFAEVQDIADALLAGCTVFLNLEATERDICRRLLDFVSGVAYCIDGNIKRVTGSTYIVSPSSVDVSESAMVGDTVDPEL